MRHPFRYVLIAFLLHPLGLVQAQGWEWLNPLPTGNGIRAVAVAGDRLAWIVDDAGVVMRSQDAGLTWSQQGVPVQIGLATLTFFDSLYGWVVGGFANPGEDGIIIHTSNGGRDWAQQAGGISHFILDVDFVSRDCGWVLAQGRFDGPSMIVATTDAGEQWDTLAVLTEYHLLSIEFVDAARGWAVGNRVGDSACVLQSLDGGSTWTVQLTLDDTYFADICFLDSLDGWATASCGLVCHTTDGGNIWDCQRPSTSVGGPSRIVFSDHEHGWIASGTTTHPILWTTDGGQSWSQFQPPTSAGIGSVACWDSLHVIAVGANGYIFRTEDGGANWTEASYHRDWSGLGSGAFADSLHGWLIGGVYESGTYRDVIWRTTDGGRSWTNQSQGIGTPLKWARFVSENTGWLVGLNGLILYTTNAGAVWTQQSNLVGRGITDADFCSALRGTAVGGNTIFSTADGGEVWSEQSSNAWGSLCSVAYSDAWNVWAVGSVLVNPDSSIYIGVVVHSSDGGTTWSHDTLEGSWELDRVQFGDSQVGFITEYFGRRLLRTADGGLSWCECPNPCRNVVSSVQATSASDVWAIADMVEIVHSTDSGATWTYEPLMYAHWLRTLIVPDPRHVWAIGPDGCVFRYGETFSPVPERRSARVPTLFSVAAYPNPFNPTTTLMLSVANSSWFTIKVFDVTGRLVETLSNGLLPAGIHRVRFDGSNLSSGMYFTSIETHSDRRTLKLLLLK
jgi:photosystem II stability/assembly factor-like uncharacterized protein